ncbi:MAG: hypothetical protein FWC26_01890 [Fibromonadales bacterium]|nr:hypothetical protein [Fibromonadales bacterium]
MVWIILLILLPAIIIIGAILYFNIYFRRQIKKDITPMPTIDQAYIEAERTRPDDEDLGNNVFNKGEKRT